MGEATVHEQEAEAYTQIYLELLDALHEQQKEWHPLPPHHHSSLDYHYSPKVQIAVKATSLYSQTNPIDFENSVQAILKRTEILLDRTLKPKLSCV